MPSNSYCDIWLKKQDGDLTVDAVAQILGSIDDDLWVIAACYDRVVEVVDVQRALVKVGLSRTSQLNKDIKTALPYLDQLEDADGQEDGSSSNEEQPTLSSYLEVHERERRMALLRLLLLDLSDLLETYADMSAKWVSNKEETEENSWEDDPWADASEDPSELTPGPSTPSRDNPITLVDFLSQNLLDTAMILASSLQFPALQTLMLRHAPFLLPHRFTVLECIPEHAHPSYFRFLLPVNDFMSDMEQLLPSEPRRASDWLETSEMKSILQKLHSIDGIMPLPSFAGFDAVPKTLPMSAKELSAWYQRRIHQIDSSSGLVDIALAYVQNGAANNVPGLDQLGEELTLLSRLVYDAPQHKTIKVEDWTLEKWYSMSPAEVVRAYLAGSTPASVEKDIRGLVMPYLFVLEAQRERAGQPDPQLPPRLLYEYILVAPLDIAAAIFEASKPTLPISQRIIRNDEDLARVALACLYGSKSVSEWSTMSAIFECLPEWEKDEATDEDEADATLLSLATFVAPSTTQPRVSPSDLLMFFQPLPAASLSRALDVLDTHLWSGDILARWNVPAPLTWFLQSANDENQQRAWAIRMSRRAGDGGQGEELENEDEWQALLDDMLRLVDDGSAPGSLRGAFWLIPKPEIVRIFFNGLLSTGRFNIASSILNPSEGFKLLNAQAIEEICLTVSREFYDNSSSGNLHHGEMKLAYDCLGVAPPTLAIISEREFIEATSRICSFNVVSRPGIPISPLEIRLVKDRLTLVGRVLSSTEDAYKHSELVLDLVRKLGYRDDVAAEVKTLSMLATAALQAEDFVKAEESAERMVDRVRTIRSSMTSQTPAIKEAIDVCWQTCFQLGRQSEFQDVTKKLRLLGYTLEFCPPENTLDVLSVWRRVESEDIEIRRERLEVRKSSKPVRKKRTSEYATLSLPSRLQDLNLPSSGLTVGHDAAAVAARTFNRVAATFPFSVRGKLSKEEGGRSSSETARSQSPDVSSQARHALARGVGWLIGATDEVN